MIHQVIVEVDEEGAKATGVGSVIGGEIATGPTNEYIAFDRPFIFVIDERSTGSVLFMGAVNAL